MNKNSLSLTILLLCVLLFSCGIPITFPNSQSNDCIELEDLPSENDCKTKPNVQDLEVKFETALGNHLMKSTFSNNSLLNLDIYMKITDSSKNIVEFNTNKNLNTYSYKVIEGNWVILSNKNSTIPFKFISSTNGEVVIHIPSSFIIPSSGESVLGIKLIFKESSDDVHFEHNHEIEENIDPEIKPDPVPTVPKEKIFTNITSSMSGTDFMTLIKNENISKTYMNITYDNQSNLLYENGNIEITDNTFIITGPSDNLTFKFEITKIEKKVNEEVYVATLNVTEVPQNKEGTEMYEIKYSIGTHYLTFEKRGGISKLALLNQALRTIFVTTNEYASPKLNYIDLSTDVMTKLVSILVNEENVLLLIVPGEMHATNFGTPLIVDNKLYLNNKFIADIDMLKGGYGKLNTRGGGASACVRINFSNSNFEHLKNKAYDFEIYDSTKVINGYSEGETIVFFGPKDSPIGMTPESIEEFHQGFEAHLNKVGTVDNYRKPIEGQYKLTKETVNNDVVYKILDTNDRLYTSFSILDAGYMGQKNSQYGITHCGAIKIIESNTELLKKDGLYMILESYWGFIISEYDENYFIELKWKKIP